MNDTMRALVMRNGALHLESAPVPVPESGQVLVRSLACGICGSDLHITRHSGEVLAFFRELGVMTTAADTDPGIMLGHEYCAEVIAYGPDTEQRLPPGTRVTSVPLLMSMDGAGVGVTPGIAGAYSEYFILDEQLLLPVPDNVPASAAALTEPPRSWSTKRTTSSDSERSRVKPMTARMTARAVTTGQTSFPGRRPAGKLPLSRPPAFDLRPPLLPVRRAPPRAEAVP